ncbi:MgtE-domain-containing protein [Exidia glandulosa HHB12029]|uniref:MgtE-domain-containing protein n=1 Tax=Exidia glandulosa HHB12029 TaxID=1314781 RepID=A0A165GPH4_EXIGL|nr:MgtE-domain-containing protein [Exidia glandulosa HHB12029]
MSDTEPILHEATSSRYMHDPEPEPESDSDDGAGAKLLPDASARTRGRERSQASVHHAPHEEESNWKVVRDIVLETAPTLVLTTVGLVFTGELLERVSEWHVFKRVDDLIILVPMINNLKGNLEMNLSARLATAANIGELDNRRVRTGMVFGNLCLLQVQALVVSALAAALSFALGAILGTPAAPESTQELFRRVPRPGAPSNNRGETGLQEFVFVLVTSQVAAGVSGLVLGAFMASLIIVCRRFAVDPDNIATPIAACLGDLLTLLLLALVGTALLGALTTFAPILLAAVLIAVLIGAVVLTLRNPYVRPLLSSGWGPLIGAMVISSGAGMVLDHYVERYEGFGVLAIVTGGLPGSVGSVFVSRLSTALHAHGEPGAALGPHTLKSARPRLVALALFGITLPVTVGFIGFLQLAGWTRLPFTFLALFVLFFSIAVAASLALGQALTLLLWKRGLDPDTYALPIQSSLVDLFSQVLLVACYLLANALGADVMSHRKR